MVSVSAVTYRYGSGKVLSFPDFHVASAEACLLLGNSGSGKTTLLHLMGGLLKMQKGRITIRDQELAVLSETETDHFRGQYIGFVFQKNHLITALTVKQNLMMAPFLAGLRQDEGRVEEVLADLGLLEKRDERIQRLSQGQAQRVAIARAVLNKPAVIFADEPTSALDDHHCNLVIRLLLQVSSQNGSSLVIATHDHRLKTIVPRHVEIGYA